MKNQKFNKVTLKDTIKVLSFYAEPKNYAIMGACCESDVQFDQGEKARKLLKSILNCCNDDVKPNKNVKAPEYIYISEGYDPTKCEKLNRK